MLILITIAKIFLLFVLKILILDYISYFQRKLASANKEIIEPLLCELAETEEANRTGKMTVNYLIIVVFNRFYSL